MSEYLLGKFIRDYRQAHALSLRDLGNMCGISHTTIDCIEKGFDPRTKKPVNITNTTFRKLSEAMGIPAHVLVDLSNGNDDFVRVPGGWATQSYLAAQVASTLNSQNQIAPESKKTEPTPVSEDGLSKEQLELVRLFSAASPELRAAALAVLRSAEGQGKAPDGGLEV